MATLPALALRPGATAVAPEARAARRARPIPLAGELLSGALVLLILYAAADHGAAAEAASARVEVALCALAAAAVGATLWTGGLRFRLERRARVALALLLAFAVWSGASLAWSAAPDATWLEFNRDLSYVVALALAVVLGATHPRLAARFADGLLLACGIIAAYALGQKVLPGLHVAGLINLNQAGPIPRLQEPLGYWNALALFVALAVPLALFRAVDKERTLPARVAFLVLAQLMVVVIGFTLSRGALLALVLALLITLPLAGPWLRSLGWVGLCVIWAAPPLAFGLADHSLSSVGVPLGTREGAGAILLAIFLASTVGLIGTGARLMVAEAAVDLPPQHQRRIKQALTGVLAASVAAAIIVLALSSRGLPGQISHAWSSFTATHQGSIYNPQHLLSGDSENRWVWWKEAAGAFSDRPLAGWGAGSFAVVDRLYRRDLLSVRQPHSLPLQFLSETGIVGALLALGAFALLLAAAIRTVRRTPAGAERLARAGLLAGGLTFLIHILYDWDWDIPAVTLPALVLLGLLVAAPERRRATPEENGQDAPARGATSELAWLTARRTGRGLPGARALAMVGCLLALCTVALAAALPSLAAGAASTALVEAGSGSRSLATAERDALLSERLDPLSDAGLKVEATIALRDGRPRRARTLLVQAVAREPTDTQAWQQLLSSDLALADLPAAVVAADRMIQLDPRGFAGNLSAYGLDHFQTLLLTPPRDSATAVATPGAPPAKRKPRPSGHAGSTTPAAGVATHTYAAPPSGAPGTGAGAGSSSATSPVPGASSPGAQAPAGTAPGASSPSSSSSTSSSASSSSSGSGTSSSSSSSSDSGSSSSSTTTSSSTGPPFPFGGPPPPPRG